MTKKKSGLSNLLSYLSYKKPEDLEEFYIPEINEDGEQPQQHGPSDKSGKSSDKAEKSSDRRADKARPKPAKKPTPVSEMKKDGDGNKSKGTQKEISSHIEDNIDFIKEQFNSNTNKDIIIREFNIGGKHRAFIAYIDGMVDRMTINNFILRPLLRDSEFENEGMCQIDYILSNVLETNQAQKVAKPDEIIYEILSGNTCLYIDGCNFYISNETKGFEKRGVEQPLTEGVVKGSQEAFNENLRTNTTLIRRIIKNKNLTTEFMKLGEVNKNQCAIMYLADIANPAIVKEVKRRLKGIKTDLIMGDGFIEQFIEDHPFSPIPTILSTERPDRAASHIVEGKVVILSEGVPFVLIVPITFDSFIHSPEDSSLRWQYSSLLRVIRLIAFLIATLLPGLYMALTNFHSEMIPTDLLIAIGKARENVPFPTILEVLLMEFSFELIREAGIRIPGIIGNTIGIIGALILGQAAVQANLVSPVMIIIVSVTGLGNFAIPNFSLAFSARIGRIFFIILGASLGFYGITLGIVAVLSIFVNLKSFGVPYFTILAPKVRKSSDYILKMPIWKQELRPDYVNAINIRRQPKISRTWEKDSANETIPEGEEDNNE